MYFIYFLICPMEVGVRLIHPCALYAVKYGIYKKKTNYDLNL